MIQKITFLSLMMFFTLSLFAERTITGYVYDEAGGEPLIAAQVMVKGTDKGITTDYEGFFELIISDKEVSLIVTYLGYEKKEVIVAKNKKEIRIPMKASKVLLDEVTVSEDKDAAEEKAYEEIVAVKRKEMERDAMPTSAIESYAVGSAAAEVPRKKPKKNRKGKKASSTPPPPPPPPVLYDAVVSEPVPVEASSPAYDDVMAEMGEVEEVMVLSDSETDMSKLEGKVAGISTDLPSAGQLTAGILNDYGKWNLWQDIQENELKEWQGIWDIRPWDRYPIQLTTQNGYPIVNAKVHLKEGNTIIWSARTDNTGKAELWSNLYEQKEAGKYSMEIEYEGETYKLDAANSFHEGGNAKVIPVQCNISKTVDIAFVVDATGSMGDEIGYLKSELTDVITRSKDALKDVELRLGSVFYRDLGDAYITRKSHFSTDINKTVAFIKEQGAAGGGDGPEAIEEALDEALDNMAWSEDAAARLLFLVLDAPPHQTEAIKNRLKTHIERAAKMGIRIVPVACSGTGRSTEYFMRSFALATNGSYIYLTDDSGIGGSHQKPITDEHKVNLLNDLLVQTITDFSTTVSCDEQLDFLTEDIQDTMEVSLVVEKEIDPNQKVDPNNPDKVDIIKNTEFTWKYYPNPSRGQLWIEIEGELDFLYLFDGAGKMLRRITITDRKFEIDIRDYPSGMYFLRGIGKDEREVSGKVILIRSS